MIAQLLVRLDRLLGIDFDPARDAIAPPYIKPAKPVQTKQVERKANEPDKFGLVVIKPEEAQVTKEWQRTSVNVGKVETLTDAERNAVANYTAYKLDVNIAARLKPIIINKDMAEKDKIKQAKMSERLYAHYRKAIRSAE